MNYCCQDKKYFSELCPSCVESLTNFDSSNLEYPQYAEYSEPEWPGVTYNIRCECGSEKTGGPGHSHWCPKNENKT
jgi:hypothetical protein